jgi:hypothetical protein
MFLIAIHDIDIDIGRNNFIAAVLLDSASLPVSLHGRLYLLHRIKKTVREVRKFLL